MKVLMLDIWHDLTSKRVLPIAIALLVAIVAVPVLLLKGGSPPPPESPPAATADGAAALAGEVSLAPEPLGGSSRLDSFDPHNPFRPRDARGGSAGQVAAAGDDAPGAPDQGPAAPPPGTGSSTPPAPRAGATGSDDAAKTPGGASSGDGGGGGSGKADDSARTPSTRVERIVEPRVVAYAADMAYGRPGTVRRRQNVRPLTVVPQRRRLLLFSGVRADGETAVFTVLDPGLDAEPGDGRCSRIEGRCRLLYLRPGDERRFREPDGDRFRLRLIGVDPVAVRPHVRREVERELEDALPKELSRPVRDVLD